MKKVLLLLSALALLSGCSKNDGPNSKPQPSTEEDVQINLSNSSLLFAAKDAPARTVSVTCTKPWTATTDATWLTLTPSANGKTLTVKADDNICGANETPSVRKATITITADKATASIAVNQEKGERVITGTAYTFASYNLRYDSKDDTGNKAWSKRKTAVAKLIQDRDFDVCGFVEVTQPGMLNDLNSLLGGTYTIKVCGRGNGSTNGEAVGFAFKASRFEMTKGGYFFLNNTPDKPGEATYWADPPLDSPYNRSRITTWGLLKDKQTGKQILYMVSHFELNKGMRAGSASLTVDKAKELTPEGVPVFFCGDLNAKPTETTCIATLSNYFIDSYAKAVTEGLDREGSSTTYNSFNSSVNKDQADKRIDYMFYKGDNVVLRKYGVIYDLVNNILPSDHYPIYVNVELK